MFTKDRSLKPRSLLLTLGLCGPAGLNPLEVALQAQEQGPVLCPPYHFGSNPKDALWPREIGTIAQGASNNLHSTTPSGGAHGFGTIFEVTPDGTMTVLWDFDSTETRANPRSRMVDGHDGFLYGTTYGGGKFGAGTIFRISCGFTGGTLRIPCPPVKLEVIYNFRNGSQIGINPPPCPTKPYCPYSPQQRVDSSASFPISASVPGSDGNLYGVTTYSNNQGYGNSVQNRARRWRQ
jgi:uncharacterized repeat protein (TIGR03803 family)